MRPINIHDVISYVEQNITTFHQKRISSLDTLKLENVLKRKNPYLFKAKYILTAEQLVRSLVDAHISSNEEAVFGNWLEGLAIYINEKVYDGRKSGIPNIDLEFDNAGVRYIVSIKSGPNWGNSSQVNKLIADFRTAKKALRTSSSNLNIIAINGCCYGRDNNPDKGEYFKYCGQRFWEFISGSSTLFTEIIEPLGNNAKEKNDDFLKSYSQMINKFTLQFSLNFCDKEGAIDWKKLVEFNSSK